jgi:hypothetical protein
MKRQPYKRKSKKRGPVVSRKVTYDGINFASGLERYMYKNRGCKRILPIKYTPDFIGEDFIIETKGRANESFPMRWKLFKQLIVRQFPGYTLYKPQNQKECDETVSIILSKQKG